MSGNGTDPELLSLRRLPSTKAAMAMGEQHSRTLGHPPTAKPRKPVPTPRNTLRKPLKPARRQSDQDSQVRGDHLTLVVSLPVHSCQKSINPRKSKPDSHSHPIPWNSSPFSI